MAGFGRSNSLSINTGLSNSASGPGLFGNTSNSATTQPQGSSLFGSNTNTNTNTNTSQPAQTGSLFGGSTLVGSSAPSQPQQTGGLFGSSLSGNTPKPPQTGGLFGGNALGASTTTTQPQQGGGMFGASLNQNRPTGSLFGNTATTATPQPTAGNSFFGGSTMNNTQRPVQSSQNLFPTLLNASTSQPLPQLGQSTAAQSGNALSIGDPNAIRGTTRFNDLSPEFQREIEAIDNLIQNEIKAKEKIDAFTQRHADDLATLPPDVSFIEGRLETVELGIENDSVSIARLKDMEKTARANLLLNKAALENLLLPSQYHHLPPSYASQSGVSGAPISADGSENATLLDYFKTTSDSLRAQLDGQVALLAQIEDHLGAVELSAVQETEKLLRRHNDGDGGVKDQIRELARTMKWFEEAVLRVAENVGKAREGVVGATIGA